MSSLSYSPDKEDEVCWTEKETLVKEEEEERDVTIQKQVEGEVVTVKEEEKDVTVKEEEDAFRVKEEEDFTVKLEEDAFSVKEEEDVTVKEEEEENEEDAVFGVKEEEGEMTVTLEEEDEVGDLFNTRAVKKWNGKATKHDLSRAVEDHLKPLVEPGVVFTTPPHLQQAGKVILFFILRGTKSLLIGQSLGSFVEIK
ncbi:X-linked retinitis pigmentosa GTPase regulator-interacting protein 1-like isoform X2 [Salvelinus fontinalis]|uniref:X-linked retinitis pigmentosa GTPase regulator-interacting protein 1-like isoform X2 n=1 Tax=Salvelinus fontinalis TaxID=8038 RepID=UPI002485751A|nr:X-linked retinitis pigmentosa GTPase regulator-interacting protein 1-like isoform X2 [Salvelinus fontinalis]